MLRKQIPLNDLTIQDKQLFTSIMYNEFYNSGNFRFVKLSEEVLIEQPDDTMNIEIFINSIDEFSGIRIQVGDPDPYLIYGSVFFVYLKESPNIERLANFHMEYNYNNYSIVNNIIKKVSGKDIILINGFTPS